MDRSPDSPTSRNPDAESSRVSGLAITAVVLALVPCCPPASLLAAMLGVLAYRRIVLSRGGLRGLGLARAAVFAGLAMTVLSLVLWMRFGSQYQQRVDQTMNADLEHVMEALVAQRVGEVQSLWSSSAPIKPTKDEIVAFGAELTKRYGAFSRIGIVSQTGNGFSGGSIHAAVIFHFTDDRLNGSVELHVEPSQILFLPTFRPRSILVEDPVAGDLRLPTDGDG